MTETKETLIQRISDATSDLILQDILLENDPHGILSELMGLTMVCVLKAVEGTPKGLRLNILYQGFPKAFKTALAANVENLLDGHYEPKEPTDA